MCRVCSAMMSPSWVRPAERAASTLGVTLSMTSRTYPGAVTPSSTAARVAATAPHESWPRTTTRGQFSTLAPYSMLPSTSGPVTWPAVRTTNRSPSPWSKMISAARRESEQPKSTAKGFWAGAISERRSASWLGCSSMPATNRWLPASSISKASRGVSVEVSVMAADYGQAQVTAPVGEPLRRPSVVPDAGRGRPTARSASRPGAPGARPSNPRPGAPAAGAPTRREEEITGAMDHHVPLSG